MKKWLSTDLLYLYSPTSIEQRIRRQPLENFIPTSHISSYDKEFHVNRPRGRAEESSESNANTIERHEGADSAIPSSSACADGTAHLSVPLRSLFTTRTIQRGERIAFIPFSSVLTGARVYKLLQTHYFSLTKRSKTSGTPRQNSRKIACTTSCSPSDALCRSAFTFDGASSTDGPSSVSVLPSGTLKGSVENDRRHGRNSCKQLEQDVDYLLQQLGRIEPEKTSWNTSFAELWSRDAILLTAFLFFLKKNATSVKNRSKENEKREECKGEVQRSGEKQSDTKIPFPSLHSTFLAATSSTASPRVREIQKSDRSWNAVQRWVAHWPPAMPSFGPGLHCLESHDMTFQSPNGWPTTPRCPSSPPSIPFTTPSLSSSTLHVPLLSTVNGEAAPTTRMERVEGSSTLPPSFHDPVQQAGEKKSRTLCHVPSMDDHAMWLAKAMQKGVHAAVEEDDALCVHEKEAKEIKTCVNAVVQRTPQQLKDFFSGNRSSALTVRQHHQQVVPCATIVSSMRRKYLCRLEKETDHMLGRVWEAMKGGAMNATASSFSASSSSSDDVGKRREEKEQEKVEEEEEANLRDLRWSHFMVRSRGVRLRQRGSDALAWKGDHRIMGGNEAEAGSVNDDDADGCHEGLALVPFLDMLNHSAKHYNVTYTTTATAPVSSFPLPSCSTRHGATNDLREGDGMEGVRLPFTRRTASSLGNGEGGGGILVLAARTIHAGEELTMHYGNDRQRGIETRSATTLFGGQEMEGGATHVGGDRYVGAANRRVPPYSASSHFSRRLQEKAVRPQPVSEVLRDWRTREEFDTLTPPALQATSSMVPSRSGTIQPLDIRIPEGLLLRAATRWHTNRLPLEERRKGNRIPIEEPLNKAVHVLLPGRTPKEAIGQRERGEKNTMGVSSSSDEMVHHTESIPHTTLSTLSTSEDVRSLAAEVQEEEELLHRLCKLYQKRLISPSAVDAKVKAVQARREAEAEVEWIWRFGFTRSEEEILLEASRRWCSGLRARIAQLTDARRHGRPGEFVLGVPEGLQHLREQRLHLERDRYHNKRIFPPQNHFTPLA